MDYREGTMFFHCLLWQAGAATAHVWMALEQHAMPGLHYLATGFPICAEIPDAIVTTPEFKRQQITESLGLVLDNLSKICIFIKSQKDANTKRRRV
jgi:hypothetical protein